MTEVKTYECFGGQKAVIELDDKENKRVFECLNEACPYRVDENRDKPEISVFLCDGTMRLER